MDRATTKAYNDYIAKLERLRSGAQANPFETELEQRERIQKAKNDIVFFVQYYLQDDTPCESADFHYQLARIVKRNKTLKCLVRWGRGLAKSVWCDLIIPLWLWINDDIHYMVIVGNNLDKAKILLGDLQAQFAGNQRLLHDFGQQEMLGEWTDGHFSTQNGFTAKALGMGQSPRGLRYRTKRPDYIVCDDLEDKDTLKNPRRQNEVVQWIEHDLLHTMDGKTRRYLHPNNNFAPRTIQEELRIKHPGWRLHRVDAYDPVSYKPAWPQKYPVDYYREVENEVGTIAANAEYNNRPYVEGKEFNEKQIHFIDKYPRLNRFRAIVCHWDVAYSGKNDFNACRVWGLLDKNFYYIASYVAQSKMEGAIEWMIDFKNSLPETAGCRFQFESQFWNDAVTDAIKKAEEKHNTKLFLVKVDTPRTKKFDRIMRLQPYYQNGRIYYNKKMLADKFTQEGLQQLYGIEPGYRTHDDAPDADEQAIAWLERFIRINGFKPVTGQFTRNNKRKF